MGVAPYVGKGEANPFIPKLEEFFSTHYKKQIEDLVREYPQKRSLVIDFKDLEEFDFQLADELIDHPDLVLEAARLAAQKIDVPALEIEVFAPNVRVRSLPRDRMPLVKDISARHLGKLITLEGVIRQLTDVLPKLKTATWSCKRCSNTYVIEQDGHQLRKPNLCTCKHRDFELVPDQSTFVDYQKIQIQEPLELLKGSEQAVNLDVYIQDDFVNKVAPGDRTQITGILRLYPPNKEKKAVYGRYLEAIHLEETEKEFEEVNVADEDVEAIKALAQNPRIYGLLSESIAPTIYGHEIVKESISLQLFGGVKKLLPGEMTIRGNIHVLLVGDPGTGKSQLLQATDRIAPKSVYVSGKTSSGVGLTASAVKDDFGEGGWTLKAGALVLASGGMVMVDEFDKMECLTGDTLVCTQNGELKPIQTIFEEAKKEGRIEKNENGTSIRDIQNRYVLSMDENLKIVKRKMLAAHEYPHQGRILEIRLQSGEKIKTTPNHPFFSTTEKEVKTIKAGKLKEGDFILVPARLPNEEAREFNEKQSRLYGYLAGDGNVTYNPPENYMVRFTNKDAELLDDFSVCCESIFEKPTIYPSEIREGGLMCTRANGQAYVDFIAKHAPGLMEKFDQKYTPSNIYHSTQNTAHYLRGIFDSEGNVDTRHQQVGFASTSERLTMEVKALLLKHGIVSQIQHKASKEKRRASYVLRITDHDSLTLFSQKIGFTSNKKQKKLNTFIQPKKERSVINVIPNAGSLLKDIRMDLGLLQKECGINKVTYNNFENETSNISIKKAQKILETFTSLAFNKNISKETRKKIEYFEKLVHGDVRWRKIRKIKEVTPITPNHLSYQRTHQLNQYLAEIGMKKIVQKRMKEAIPALIRELEKKKENIREMVKNDIQTWNEAKKAIENKAIVQKNMANELGVNQSTLTRWLNQTTTAPPHALQKTTEKIKRKLLEKKEKIAQIEQLLNETIAEPTTHIYDLTIEGSHNFIANNIIVHNSEDRSSMHEAMEQGRISVAKAGLVTRFKTDTSVLAAANPKLSRFDPFKPFFEQIDLPSSLISRFDLFFMIRDTLNKERDAAITQHILSTHQAGEQMMQMQRSGKKMDVEWQKALEKKVTPIIDTEMLRKYISYARQNVFPVLSPEAVLVIQDFYVGLRDQGRQQGSYSATARQLEGLVRLAEASARVRLSDVVEKEDADRSTRLVRASLEDVVRDPETGRIDIDIVTSGQTQSSRDHMRTILDIIRSKGKEMEKVPIQDVIAESIERGIDEEKVRELITKLKRSGEIYEPSHGYLKGA
ncbi:MAG: LAGLIDADG family homing endonuclease [archaeon]|nr:LAGLIDADG family homing endonuclease [archaeon]